MVRFSIVVIIFFIGTELIFSQSLEDHYEDRVNFLTDYLLDDFKHVSTPDQADRINDINVRVIRNPANLNSPVSVNNGGQRYIFITTGFLHLLQSYSDILLIEGEFGRENLARSYFDYYFETVLIKKSKTPPLQAHHYTLSESGVEDWLNADNMIQSRDMMLISSIVVILAHEVGHHALDNFYNPNSSFSEKKISEEKTDDWAYNTLYKLNQNPIIGALTSTGLLLEMERFQNKYSDSDLIRYHASPKTRAMKAWEIGCANQADENVKRVCDFLKSSIESM